MRQVDLMIERNLRLIRDAMGTWLDRRSIAAVNFFDFGMERVIACWLTGMVLLAIAKVTVAPTAAGGLAGLSAMILPFLAVTLAPVLGYRIAHACFPRDLLPAQPSIRLCRYGSWRPLDHLEARRSRAYGPTGFMASLLAGMMLNVPFRTAEFMLSMPAIPVNAPLWASTMMTVMTLDVVVLNFFYMVCFVMALRAAPLFPRMLIFTWVLDLVMQLLIAGQVSQVAGLPPQVAGALQSLLSGNIDKVLISAALWLPYLILSERVNVTFRHRVRSA
ncbi:hypothetical protein GCM10011494_00640 [Novosphingobium endophyticum]|uniref:DUF2569 domain-containing protein n=1 Tax=Novosphingobium endophyticum TaxID=1955250 RepID=A0A916TP90_9SPHN|nr:DUF2569 family protein [Novosphingobium endophyticum]GGB86216.1 hypothetical protein GCM10011494_00640 [Novosphingobium endophyticum]